MTRIVAAAVAATLAIALAACTSPARASIRAYHVTNSPTTIELDVVLQPDLAVGTVHVLEETDKLVKIEVLADGARTDDTTSLGRQQTVKVVLHAPLGARAVLDPDGAVVPRL
ncbi:hypothetical protein [Intrasporangium calvum]|uniref:hypothetical protein n=1 Tax=Intrasporangium calvum TaxID=53358 RepID=UPI0011D1D152|nr:hypothetical protein [Intrasporangium calvum]